MGNLHEGLSERDSAMQRSFSVIAFILALFSIHSVSLGQDLDFDEVPDEVDNCPNEFNPDQSDANANGVGDACETDAFRRGDANADAIVDFGDALWIVNEQFRGGPATVCYGAADADADGFAGF